MSQSILKQLDYVKIVVTLLLLVALCAGGFYFWQTLQSESPEQEAQDTLEKIGKLMELPIGEVPSIATVVDKTQLQDQEFLNKAENGDKIVIYQDAKKAILYRPSTNKIIDVSPVRTVFEGAVAGATEQDQEAISSSELDSQRKNTPSGQPVSVYILDDTDGRTNLQEFIENMQASLNVLTANSADAVKSYEGIQIVAITEAGTTQAQAFATALGGIVSQTSLSSENIPDRVDIVVILGGEPAQEEETDNESNIEATPTENSPEPTQATQ